MRRDELEKLRGIAGALARGAELRRGQVQEGSLKAHPARVIASVSSSGKEQRRRSGRSSKDVTATKGRCWGSNGLWQGRGQGIALRGTPHWLESAAYYSHTSGRTSIDQQSVGGGARGAAGRRSGRRRRPSVAAAACAPSPHGGQRRAGLAQVQRRQLGARLAQVLGGLQWGGRGAAGDEEYVGGRQQARQGSKQRRRGDQRRMWKAQRRKGAPWPPPPRRRAGSAATAR